MRACVSNRLTNRLVIKAFQRPLICLYFNVQFFGYLTALYCAPGDNGPRQPNSD